MKPREKDERERVATKSAGRASRARKPAARSIAIQRAYAEPTAHDGYRVLVDRFWPRGRSRAALKLDAWARDLAPSSELIRWFGHDAEKWTQFRTRYRAELSGVGQRECLRALLDAAGARPITLVYGARSETQNQAVVLRAALRALERA